MRPLRSSVVSLTTLVALVTLLAGCASAPASVPAGSGDGGVFGSVPFSADPVALADVVAGMPVDERAGVRGAMIEEKMEVLRDGTVRYTTWMVYQIATEAALNGWAGTEVGWSSWYQDRPQITARIINPGGIVVTTTDASAVETSGDTSDPLLYTDHRALRLPYPGARVGSVVEQLVVTTGNRPFFAEGIVNRLYLQHYVDYDTMRTIVEYPEGSPVRVEPFGIQEHEPRVESDGTTSRYSIELRSVHGFEDSEYGVPYDVTVYPNLVVSTGKNWETVAAGYERMVDQSLASMDFTSIARSIAQGGSDDLVTEAIRYVQREVRYTGLQLGENSIRPADAATILARGFGDCKDMATVTVGILRSLGMNAYVALLGAGDYTDIPDDTPGLGLFDHAIVYVDGDEPRWIDATARFTDHDVLPPLDQDRKALIARAGQSSLVTTTAFPASASTITSEITIALADDGWGSETGTSSYGGPLASGVRSWYSYYGVDAGRDSFTDDIEKTFRFGTLGDYSISDPAVVDEPFVIHWSVTGAGRVRTADDSAIAVIMPEQMLDSLPDYFYDDSAEPREHPHYWTNPFRRTWRFRIVAPAGYSITSIPEASEIRLGQSTFHTSASIESPGVGIFEAVLDTGPRRMTAVEFDEARKAATAAYVRDGVAFTFSHEGARLIAEQNYAQGFQVYRDAIAGNPESIAAIRRYAGALLGAGLRQAAEDEIKAALEEHPDSATLYAELGWILTHDIVGRANMPGWDRDGAIAAYRASLDLDPANAQTWKELGSILERSANGTYRGNGADLAGAFEAYRYMIDELDDTSALAEAIESAMLVGDLNEARRFMGLLNDANANELYGFVLDVLALEPSGIAARARAIGAESVRADVLSDAESLLLSMREYQRAAEVIRISARGTSNVLDEENRARVIASVHPGASFTGTPVERVAYEFMMGIFSMSQDGGARLRAAMSPELYNASIGSEESREQDLARVIEGGLVRSGADGPFMEDMLQSLIKVKATGSPQTAYQAEVSIEAVGDSSSFVLFIDDIDGQPRVIGSSYDSALMGAHIVAMLDAGRVAAARSWLTAMAASDGPARGLIEPLGLNLRNAPDARRAATVLMAYGGDSVAIESLRTSLPPETKPDQRRHLLGIIADGYRAADEPRNALPIARDLYVASPGDSDAAWRYAAVLTDLHDTVALESFLTGGARDYPELSTLTLDVERRISYQTGDSDRLASVLERLVSRDPDRASSYLNGLAWQELFKNPIGDRALSYVSSAIKRGGSDNGPTLHTAATALAMLGRPEDALALLRSSMDADYTWEPAPHDWLVLGYIARSYGLPDVADEFFGRVTVQSYDEGNYFSSHALAQWALGE